ncbi:Nramp family divalent metal transporter [Schlesneria paludicola]|uniref:Nramp family divalent metal transporter n=1 Tax=Schlesneria paludicola TaxID=360056 RepID=UPI00029A82C4|nr:Nramp family divalent metal transporter [Schlesneria paludicola]
MADAPQLPRTLLDWIRVFGPGAIMASLTIGTGELIFSTRGGALFGYHILFVFALTSLLKWSLVISTSRHMVLTGVHPYERMLDLPGPRGWLPIMLLLISVVAMPIWITFHSSVLGSLVSWLTETRNHYQGGIDYLWGAAILVAILILSATGGYEVLEKTQTFVVLAMVVCAGLTLVLYKPDWVQLLLGLLPHSMSYPEWLPERYPQIAKHSVWVEVTRYIGVIGGAGFDYLSYTSWLREKSWGVLPHRASDEMLREIAADPNHRVRRWVNAPLVDCAISFLLVIVFSAVFVASGTMFLGPEHVVPDEENLLNLQARFVTQIHPWLLPLYVVGAFLTMLGTLYGTVEIACSIADEIVRSFVANWTEHKADSLRRGIIGWCASVAFVILGCLFAGQASPTPIVVTASKMVTTITDASEPIADETSAVSKEQPSAPKKPRLLLAVMTPVNLLTGVLSCGVICWLTIWMDRRWLPATLQPPPALICLNFVSGLLFIGLGLKGFWDNDNRVLALFGLIGLFATSLLIAMILGSRRNMPEPVMSSPSSEPAL